MGFLDGLGDALASGINGALGGIPGMVIGGLAGLVNKEQSINDQKRLAALNHQYNLDLMQQQYTMNLNATALANEYNKPKNAMSRLRDAGLNPNLVYGGSSGQVAGTSATPSVSLGSSRFFDPSSLLASQMQMAQMLRENELAAAQVRKLDAETEGQKLSNSFDLRTLEDRVLTSTFVREKAGNVAELSRHEADMAYYKEALANDEYNIRQLLLHGEDAAVIYNAKNMSPDMTEDKYRADLYESDLYNSIKDMQRLYSLNAKETEQKIKQITEFLKQMPVKLDILGYERTIKEFHANLAKEGFSPGDNVLIRVITALLNNNDSILGKGMRDLVEAIRSWW